jgi:hypothetical protein
LYHHKRHGYRQIDGIALLTVGHAIFDICRAGGDNGAGVPDPLIAETVILE